MMHSKARFEKTKGYPEKFSVPDDKVDWNVPFEEYNPPYYTDSSVIENSKKTGKDKWADPEDVILAKMSRQLRSDIGPLKFDAAGFPLNPVGRTGLRGRGKLGKWATNFAADPIITRRNPETGSIEMIAILRNDTKEWAIPGGMVDDGETVSETLKRELKEETGLDLNMANAEMVYKGYADDPRNTDNAWIETVAKHLHLNEEQEKEIKLSAGSDADNVQWLTLTEENLQKMYANHADFVRTAMQQIKPLDNIQSPQP